MSTFVLALVLIGASAAAPAAAGDAADAARAAAAAQQPSSPLGACPAAGAITASCSWPRQQPLTSGTATLLQGTKEVPLVLVASSNPAAAPPPGAGDASQVLELQRLVIAGAPLSAPDDPDVPPLLPAGLYSRVPAALNITDARLLVQPSELAAYLAVLRRQLPAAAQWHSDGQSFLHIAAWYAGRTQAHSVTLLAGPCNSRPPPAAAAQLAAMLDAAGCNVRAVSNATLVPTMRAASAVATPAPLLLLLTSNVSLGAGLRPGAVAVHRPVVLAGLFSVPTSVDLGMTVNQINATSTFSKVFWQSLFLENAAPGDAVSSLLSRPMSSAVSANVFAVYCDRMHNCLNLNNCTVVLASQAELNYVTYMYSMFNSPLPNMRSIVNFYHSELRCVVIQMGPGPGGVGMMLYNLTCGAWSITRSVFTTQPAVAPRLPFPPGAPQITTATRAGPLVQAVRDCGSLQEAMRFRTVDTRLHVWMLADDVTLGRPPGCLADRAIRYPTQVYGQQQADADSVAAAGGSSSSSNGTAAAAAGAGARMFVLDFAGERNALLLQPPASFEGEHFFSVHNTSMRGLPQGPGARAPASAPGRLPPGVFALLLWPLNRTLRGTDPVQLADTEVLVPQPELDFYARRAAAASSFVVQLEGDTGDIVFTGAAPEAGGGVRVASFDGPGVIGSNVVLRPEPRAAALLGAGYFFPAAGSDLQPAAAGGGLSRAEVAGVVVGSLLGLLLLLAAAVAMVIAHQRRHRRALASAPPPHKGSVIDVAPLGGGISAHPSGRAHSSGGKSGQSSSNTCEVCVDSDRDDVLPADGGRATAATPRRSSDAAAAAAAAAAVAAAATAASSAELPAHAASSAGAAASNSAAASGSLARSGGGYSNSSDSVATGLERWRAAISSTTLQLMQRRMALGQQASASSGAGSSGRVQSTGLHANQPGAAAPDAQAAAAAAAAAGGGKLPAGGSPITIDQGGLQIHELIGQGSFGSVWKGTWHGKRVAVKIIQLPATGLMAGSVAPAQRQQQEAGNSPPHMAIMEAVVSSTLAHPNVVQVFTTQLTPLSMEQGCSGSTPAAAAADGAALDSSRQGSKVTGWELKIIMELCSEGTLREALDSGLLLPRPSAAAAAAAPSSFPPVPLLLSLAHDIAAALLHLHNQGIVHGDLKAANCLLKPGEDAGSSAAWPLPPGCTKFTAKVADFGLALPLDPSNTHATLAARGTPTHMSPELFLSGHVSTSSDVYAFGVLLYELVSGRRAYAGVPVPLLPHEVAVKSLRPTWPPELPAAYGELRALADACWAQLPEDRPTAAEIFSLLDSLVHRQQHKAGPPAASGPRQQQQQLGGGGNHRLGNMSWSEVTVHHLQDQQQQQHDAERGLPDHQQEEQPRA